MKTRQRKVFERVVNPLLIKHLVSPWLTTKDGRKITNPSSCIASGIPIKYLKYFKAISKNGKGHKLRYRYRGVSKPNYRRVSSFCHMAYADTFAIYYR